MGKGDRKTRKGKISIGSYGNLRKRKKSSGQPVVAKKEESVEKPAAKKTTAKKETTAKKATAAKKTTAKKTTKTASKKEA